MSGAFAFPIGEASNPGPSSDGSEIEFNLGTINVAGLANKVDLTASLAPGFWGCTETQLSYAGQQSFNAAFRHVTRLQNRQVRLVHGAPAPPRLLDSEAGSWTGVLAFSDFPTRPMMAKWSGAEYSSGRVVLSATQVGSFTLTGATVYGPAKSPTFKRPVQLTREILDSIEEEIVHGSSGCRFICGDWNADLQELPHAQRWMQLGWKEIQLAAAEWWGFPIRPTSKRVAVRDYMFLSPELWRFLTNVEVISDVYPDHSLVSATLKFPVQSVPFNFWRMPARIPWQHVKKEEWRNFVSDTYAPFPWTDATTRNFRTWSARVEASIDGFVEEEGNKLSSHSKGRGQCVKPSLSHSQRFPPRASRAGEQTLMFTSASKTLLKRYKQLRRLQALLHSCRNGFCTPGSWTFQAQSWHAIVRASGFAPSFASWWSTRTIRLQGSPQELPRILPPLVVLEFIWKDYGLNFRAFEEQQARRRKEVLKLRREQCTKWLYKALRHEAAQPLDTLTKEEKAFLLEVDTETGFVQVPPHMTVKNAEYLIGDEKALLRDVQIVVEDDEVQYWACFETDRLLVPGLPLIKRSTLTEVPEIHQELSDLWISRWQQLASVPEDAWDRIMAFTRASMPIKRMKYVPLTSHTLRDTMAHGGGFKTRGPDAWSKEDLLSLPTLFLDDVAKLYQVVECGTAWPEQLVCGHVTALAKRVDAELVQDFRPVTLYSLLYRLWGSCRSRDLLAQLAEWSRDFHIFGYLHGRGCEDLTYFVQSSLEVAKQSNGHMCGAQLDIRQCFNFIPRIPLWYLARRVGVPQPIIVAWQAFLRQMTRAFKVRGQLSSAIGSDTGLPEGDAMSCVGMVLLNISFHHYMRYFIGDVTVMSYVDNYEFMHEDPAVVHRAYLVSKIWLEICYLQEDPKKTTFWALDAGDRSILKAHGLHVIEQGGDLGASMQYSKRHRNVFLQERIQKVFPIFDALRRLSAGKWYKLLALRTSLFPRALHAASNTFLGKQWLRKLRTLSMKALGDNRAGASPLARLAFVYPAMTDPAFFELHRTFLTFLRFVQTSSRLRNCWADYVGYAGPCHTYGPFSKIQRFCDDLGWSIDVDLQLHLHYGVTFSLLFMDKHRLTTLLETRWRHLLAMQIAVRKDFEGLKGVNMEATFVSWPGQTHQQTALLDCVRDGTCFVRAFKGKFDPVITGQCLHCEEMDTLEHRALRCPYFHPQRLLHPDCVRDWHLVPKALSHHGWASENPNREVLDSVLEELLNLEIVWGSRPVSEGVQHVFTDGSCLRPRCAALSLASWAAVHAETGTLIGAGVLPSMWQNIDRAELWAILQVLRWARDSHSRCCVWTDSNYALQGMCYLLDHLCVPQFWRNQDLWSVALELVLQLPDRIRLRKVEAHVKMTLEMSEDKRWMTQWNAVADSAAKRVLIHGLPEPVRKAYDDLIVMHSQQMHDAGRYQRFLLALAERGL